MKPRKHCLWLPAIVLIAYCTFARGAIAEVEFKVTVQNLPDDFKLLEPQITANIVAAAQDWVSHIDAKPCTIEIVFRTDVNAHAGRGSGRSFRTVRLGDEKDGDKLVSEQGWASRLRTGKARGAGDEADIEIVLAPDYMRTIWWDPQPQLRQARIPADKLDSMSVILHELGHALAFNGWRDPKTGKLPGGFISTYDRHVTYEGTDFFFNGPEAVKLWGQPLLLAHTRTNYHHLGERLQGRDAELKGDLMNGIVLEYHRRYHIGQLDLAILADCSIPLKPEKGTSGTGQEKASARGKAARRRETSTFNTRQLIQRSSGFGVAR